RKATRITSSRRIALGSGSSGVGDWESEVDSRLPTPDSQLPTSMSRGRRRIRQEQTAGRPSIFFIVALVVGILFLLWFFVQALKHPVNEQSPKKHSANRATPLLA